jgi:GTP:adenosylcobinamide-phosphate guanylyltransferase
VNAVITAGGRLEPGDAERYGTDVKALLDVNGRTLLARVIDALRGVQEVGAITVIGPRAVQQCGAAFETWVDEGSTGEENVMRALRAAGDGAALFCASDLPFVTPSAIQGLLALVPAGSAAAYPVFTRREFETAYPGARSSYFKLSDGEWTGASVLVVDSAPLLRRSDLVEGAFRARKNPAALAPMLGASLLMKFVAGGVGVNEVVARATELLGAPVHAIRGADPSLAMDCDSAADIEYARQAFK